MEKDSKQIEIIFEYAQSFDDKQRQIHWLNKYKQDILHQKFQSIAKTMLNRPISNIFIISSLILIFTSLRDSDDNSDVNIKPVTLFVIYILPFILEIGIRIIEMVIEHRQYCNQLSEQTNLSYHIFKKFKKQELRHQESSGQYYKQARSQSIRSVLHIESSQNVQDIVMANNFQEINYSELKSGDFIVLKRNEQCPGDIVIFDMSDRFGYFYSKDFDSYTVLQKKESIKITRVESNASNKGDINYLRKIYKGKLAFNKNYTFTNFEGSIKLSKDPKGETINQSNILYFGQVIQYNEWVIGMIINVGNESLYSRMIQNITKNQNIDTKYLFISIIQIIIYLIFPLIASLIQYYVFQKETSIQEILQTCFSQFLNVFPSYLNLFLLLLDIIPIFRNIDLQKINKNVNEFSLGNIEKINKYQNKQYKHLTELMNTTHIFMNIQILQDSKVEAICHSDNIYLIDQNIAKDLVQNELCNDKPYKFYLNLQKQVNQDYFDVFIDKPQPIQLNVAPNKLSIKSHFQNEPTKQKQNMIYNSPMRTQLTLNEHQRTVDVRRSADGNLLQSNVSNNNPINLMSQISQEQDDDVYQKSIQVFRENSFMEFGQQNPFEYFELFTVVSLCHLTRSELQITQEDKMYSMKNSNKNLNIFSDRDRIRKNKFMVDQYFLAEDEGLLKLSKLFSFSYKTYGYNKTEELCYVLKIMKQQLSYIIKFRLYHQGFINYDEHKSNGTQFIKIPTRFIAVIVEDKNFLINQQNNNMLLCRFCIASIFDIPGYEKFDILRKSQLQKQIQFLLNKGNQIICYLKMELQPEQYLANNDLIVNDYVRTINIIELLLYNQYELVGLFGISLLENEELKKDSFINNRTRIIIQSEKPYELMLPYCTKNYIPLNHNNESNMFNFQSATKEDILYQIRQIITSLNTDETKKSSTVIKRSYQTPTQVDKIKITNNTLIIDGHVFEVILNDKYLSKHFGFIIHFSKHIIFYNMNPSLKTDLIHYFKNYDVEFRASMCVNYQIQGSYGQMKKCDTSFQRHHDITQSVFSYIIKYDITEEDLELFDNVRIKQGFQLFQIKDASIRSIYKAHLTITLVQMIQYIYPYYQGELLQNDRMLVFQLLVPFCIIVFIVKTIKTEQEYLRIKLNSLRAKSLQLRQNHQLNLIFEIIIDFLVLVVAYSMLNAQSYQNQESSLVIFSLVLLITFLKLAFLTSKNYLKLFFFLISCLIILLQFAIELIKFDYSELSYILLQPIILLIVIWILTIKFSIKIFEWFNVYIYKHIFEKNFAEIEFGIIIETISRLYIPKINIQYLVKKLFRDTEMDLSIKNLINKGDKNQMLIQVNPYLLTFQQLSYQLEFVRLYISKCKSIGIISNLSYFFGFDIFLLIYYSVNFNNLSNAFYILMIICTFFQALLINPTNLPKYRKFVISFGILQTILRLLIISILVQNQDKSQLVYFLYYFILILSLNQQINYRFEAIIFQQLMCLITGIILVFVDQSPILNQVQKGEMVILFCISIINSIYCRHQDDLIQREDYMCTKELEIERQKYQQVMSLLLPQFVLGKLDSGNINFSENQGLVGILFVDFCSFDKIVSEEKQNIVALIDEIYRQFDQICSATNCSKIETVGKTYMACAGLQCVEKYQSKNHFKNPNERLIELAFGIQAEICNFKWGGTKSFNVKIGLHYGRVLMGVIGSIKPQFSLIGDTVNTASRMCALCPEGSIQISSQAHDQIKNMRFIKFTPKQIEAKGKGTLDTFLVEKKRNFDTSFAIRQKKKGEPEIDQKLKFVLNNQGSFHNREKNTQLTQLTGQNIRQMTLRNVTQKSSNQKKQEETNNLLPQLTGQQPISSPAPKLALEQKNTFAISQMQLFRKQTKRNIFNASHQNIVSSKNINTPILTPQQIPNQSNKNITNNLNNQVLDPSQRLVPQKSMFSHYQQELQQQQFLLQQQQNSLPPLQVSIDLNSPMVPHNKRTSQIDLTNNLDQSFHLQDSARMNGESPINQKNKRLTEDAKKYNEPNLKIVKFGDEELQIKIKRDILNKVVPLFKVQEYFLEKKQTQNIENDRGIITLQFLKESLKQSPQLQNYYDLQMENSRNTIQVSIILLLIINAFFLILSQIEIIKLQQLLVRSLGFLILSLELYLIKYQLFEWSRARLVILIIFQQILQCIIFGVFYAASPNLQILLAIETVTTSSLLFTHNWLFVLEKVFISGFMFITWLVISSSIYVISGWEIVFVIVSMLFLLERELLSFLTNYSQIQHSLQIEEKQQEKIDLLSCLLPIHVLTKFLDDQHSSKSFSDVYNDCTILFADIAGFTKYSSSVQPEEVVSMLKNIFDEFDKLTQIHNVFKLYTIGDCYVVIGVTDNLKRNPVLEAFNVVEMSLNMLEAINLVRSQINYHDLHMRIGIHTGNVIGGIIGTDIIRYDVYGKDILIANKMESSSEEGRVLVSESTKKILEDNYPTHYNFVGRKLINIPSIETIITGYFLDLDL